MKDLFEKLEELHEKDLVSLLELEFGRFLYALEESISKNILLAGMICVQKQINGHICCSINEIMSDSIYGSLFETGITKKEFLNEIKKTKVVGQPGETIPLILDGENLYLQKLWKYEQELVAYLLNKSKVVHHLDQAIKEEVDQMFSKDSSNENLQKIAVQLSLIKDLIIISGGPGTGKTFTIRKIIDALYIRNKKTNFALATPTGKAAQRLNESLNVEEKELSVNPAITIHKLLQSSGTGGKFKYNEKNKLPYDVVIIDEASMLDINLWIRLIRALSENTKLILLGDKNQLASVEAGSILNDICSESTNEFSNTIFPNFSSDKVSKNKVTAFNDCILELTKSYRFDEKSGIGSFSKLINSGKSEEVIDLLKNDSYPEVTFANPTNEVFESLIQQYVIEHFLEQKKNGFTINSFKKYQILCALRKGPFGVEQINELAEKSLKKILNTSIAEEWYEGRPIMITRNSSLLKVRNGEVGICKTNNRTDLFEIELEQREGVPISVSRIQNYEPAFATTIHKSQGSEYDHVAIILSNQPNALLSKQLFYTAVTRARKSVLVIASESVVSSAIQNNVVRRSGLRDKIWTD